MLPKNLIQNAANKEQKQQVQTTTDSNEQEQQKNTDRNIAQRSSGLPFRNNTPPKPTQITDDNKDNNNHNNGNNNNSELLNKRRAGYFYYSPETIETSVRYISEQGFDGISLVFPSLFLITPYSRVTLLINVIAPINTIYTVDQLQGIEISKLIEIIQENFNLHAPKINLTLLNSSLSPKQHQLLEQNNFIPISIALFYEFKEPLIDILNLYTTNQLSDYSLPEYIPIPVGLFSDKKNLLDTTSSANRLCGRYNLYLHYKKDTDLLYFTLTEISYDCKNYNDLLRGLTIFIPVEKFTARILLSTLKDM